MSRLLQSLLLGLIFVVVTDGAIAQDRARQTRTVEAFTEVVFGVPGTLHLRQGDERSVEVEASREALDHLETTVEDGTLQIRDDSNFFERMFGDRDEIEVNVYVTARTLSVVSVLGAGTILGETPVEGASLNVNSAGSGTIELDVRVADLSANVAGSGTFRLRGTADTMDIRMTGSGTVEAADLVVAVGTVEVMGAGDTVLHVTDRLSARIMGAGDLEYQGSPKVESSIMGSGEVRAVQ